MFLQWMFGLNFFSGCHPKKRSKTFRWLHIDVNDSGDFLEDALNETPGEGKEKVGVREGPSRIAPDEQTNTLDGKASLRK